jgi:MFS family permease
MVKIPPKFLIPQFMTAHFSHHVCTGVLVPLLPILRESFGLTYFQSGILVSSFSLSYGIGQVPLAVLADWFSRRKIVILGLILISLTGIGVSMTNAYSQMIPIFIAMGIIGGTYHAPASSYMSQALPVASRGRGLGLHVTGGAASFLVTPAIALGIAALSGTWRASFFILALPALIVGLILWFTTEEIQGDIEDPSPAAASEREKQNNVSWMQIIRSIGIVVFLSLFMQLVFASVNTYLPLFIVDQHGVSPKLAGIVISLIAGTGIVGAPLGGMLSDKIGRKQVIVLALATVGPLFFAVIYAPFGILLFLSLMMYGFMTTMRMPAMESLIADVVPVGRRTTVLGIYFFIGMETAGLTTPLVGRLIDLYGLNPVLSGLASGLCVVAVIALLLRNRI